MTRNECEGYGGCVLWDAISYPQLLMTRIVFRSSILIVNHNGTQGYYFSDNAGQKCTYKIRGSKVEATKGPDAKLYSKYFEVPEEDRKYL